MNESPPPSVFAQRPDDLQDPRFPDWIASPSGGRQEAGLFLFRRVFQVRELPAQMPVHVSADPRYKLFCNGVLVSLGPCVGDLQRWHYETVDLAPHLRLGVNVLGAEVWNSGGEKAARQISLGTAFVLGDPLGALTTGSSWSVVRCHAYQPLLIDAAKAGGGYIAGPTDRFDASGYPWGWLGSDFDASGWEVAACLGKAASRPLNTWRGTPWILQARPLPMLEQRQVNTFRLRLEDGQERNAAGAVGPMELEPGERRTLLLDASTILLGFPCLVVSQGKGGKIVLRYQEALFDEQGLKGNRDEVRGKKMLGCYDEVFPDGGLQRRWEPNWVRVARYVEISLEAGPKPLRLEAFSWREARYPFSLRGSFRSSLPEHDLIGEACWRTVEVCALETYMDCPYYEQLQYLGDTRVQGMISLYLTGDHRLLRNALEQLDGGRQPDGLLKSSHPSAVVQIIPPFTLLFVSMVRDYWMHVGDETWIRRFLPGLRFSLAWFLNRMDERGLLGPLPYWNHVDGGVDEFQAGSPPGAEDGGSIHLTLLLAHALQDAADLMEMVSIEEAEAFRAQARRIKDAAWRHGFDQERGLFRETPEGGLFTQHTNALAILCDALPPDRISAVAHALANDPSLVQGTLYFQFYVFQALSKAGMASAILHRLGPWEAALEQGLTTFPEHGLESRSDAHAWSAHPLYHFLASVAGIQPAAPGFAKVSIRPNPGSLQSLDAVVAHPRGRIALRLRRTSTGAFLVEAELPSGVCGSLLWGESEFSFSGDQALRMELPQSVGQSPQSSGSESVSFV